MAEFAASQLKTGGALVPNVFLNSSQGIPDKSQIFQPFQMSFGPAAGG